MNLSIHILSKLVSGQVSIATWLYSHVHGYEGPFVPSLSPAMDGVIDFYVVFR